MTKPAERQTSFITVENRKHQRLPIEVPVTIQLNSGKVVEGKTKNICFSGSFIHLENPAQFVVNTRCILVLILQEGPEPTIIKFKSNIIHIKPDGIGLEFKAIFAEDYNDFVYLMVNHSPDPDGLLDEVAKHPGIKIHHI